MRFNDWLGQFRTHLALDFGSDQTRLMVAQRLIWQEPTLLAWHQEKKAVLAIGTKAQQLAGKTSPRVKLVRPVQQGVIQNLEWAALYLQAVLSQQKLSQWWQQLWPHLVTGALAEQSSPVEKSQWQQVLSQVGCQWRQVGSQLEALVNLPALQQIGGPHGILDVGAEKLQLGIFAEQSLIASQSWLQTTHRQLTAAIQAQILSEYQLRIDWQTAQKLKHELALIQEKTKTSGQTQQLTVRGKSIARAGIAAKRIEAAALQPVAHKFLNDWSREIRLFLEQLPTQVLTSLQEQGLYLTGGGAQLAGLDLFLATRLQLPVVLSQEPELDLVQALWHLEFEA